MGEFFLSFLGFDAAGVLIYTRHVSGSQFHAGVPVSISYPNPNRKPLVGFYRIYSGMYSFDTINALMTTRETNLIDRDMYALPMQKHLRDEEIYTAVSKGYAVRGLAKKYGWHHGAISLAAERYAAWLGAGNAPITTRVETPKPQTFRPEVVPQTTTPEDQAIWDAKVAAILEARTPEQNAKIDTALAAFGEDPHDETNNTDWEPMSNEAYALQYGTNADPDETNNTIAYIDECVDAGLLMMYTYPDARIDMLEGYKRDIVESLVALGFSVEDIALWVSHRLTR